jgi:hypothetical protein
VPEPPAKHLRIMNKIARYGLSGISKCAYFG